MYAYTHDPETGGLLLSDELSQFSKEPRPVYAKELDILGFNQIWNYENQENAPYLWAEANFYWYRGKRVAKTVGGSLYEKPGIELERDVDGNAILPEGTVLTPIDINAMVQKNELMLEVLEQQTLKKIYGAYRKYKDKLDCFHVAFSGGKDSIVLLELVARALPRSAFMVIFGDTGMEFPDTYEAVKKVEEKCEKDGIAFYTARSRFSPEESWKIFGPPSRVLRWCCSVHKSVPQTLMIREILGKRDYTGMDFVGVRGHESATRAEYEYENYGKKQKGQYSYNPLLEWSSAEVWLYIFFRQLVVNETYKKGNSRAGCLLCPMGAGGKNDWFRRINYPQEVQRYICLIKDAVNEENIETYLTNGGWQSRQSGRSLKNMVSKISERCIDGKLEITIKDAVQNWREWSKTLPPSCKYSISQEGNNITIETSDNIANIGNKKLLRIIAKKSAYCVKCGACEINCSKGCINFSQGFNIEGCTHCGQCQSIVCGCHVANSLKITNEEQKKMEYSLNTFNDHAPLPEWIIDFFSRGNDFMVENGLGPNQKSLFRRFLIDASLIKKGKTTEFFDLIKQIGPTTEDAWGLILIQLVNDNPQMQWYVKNMVVGHAITAKEIIDALSVYSVSEKDARSIFKSFKRLCEIPLGKKLHWGIFAVKGRTLESIIRTKPIVPSERVFLYGLYRFAEACGNYYEFNLSRLLDFGIEAEGVSPAEIFAMTREEVEPILHGLARRYPDFISFTTTHDLELIKLADDKKSSDVLNLFQ